ncbi:MAG: methyltransferase [Prevotellaceae bacterium]|nr:methyltransferase [Prevotellaceae bacterium]
MPNPFFRFKQFAIRHDRCAMKVGTDGVLLGAWALPVCEGKGKVTSATTLNILDVGTGSGLIALMLAQRFPHSHIEGIDIDEASVLQATENVKASVFRGQITISQMDYGDVEQFCNKYDLIVSNPPFYKEDTLSGNVARDMARHTSFLSFETLISNTVKLLLPNGVFCVIIPYQDASDFISICVQEKLSLIRRMDIKPTPQKPPNRTLLAFSPCKEMAVNIEFQPQLLTLYDADNHRTEEYSSLTKDFYL